ncbi:MAG: hypothetical protein IJW73_05555 [Candidatus Gastranaerophilales bacterium]|nr:hypothetical protein [Candidatus Gastranaerophilales bacterium]
MQNIKEVTKTKLNIEISHSLTIKEIENWYLSGIKNDLRIGLEYERLSLDIDGLKNAQYEKLEQIIRSFCSLASWEIDFDNETIIGAHNQDGTSISLEPGCQLEISIAPKKDILAIDLELNKIINTLDEIAKKLGVVFVGYGISPVSCVDDIKVLKKERYKVMTKYLPECEYGELSLKMMRKTAGMQFNVDYKNKKDAYLKLKFFNLIMPFASGLCANSPFEKSKLQDKKSQRAHVWRYTGRERCNLFYKKVFDGFFKINNVFKNYIDSILNVPMIFIERQNNIIEINGKITFREFMENGFLNYKATMNDYILHQSLCFPDVRLKKYIEIRNHDSSDSAMALAMCAFYKGLAQSDVEKNLKIFKYLKINDIEKHNKNIIEQGLNYKVRNGICGWDVVDELFEIAKNHLNSSQRNYLESINQMLKARKTKADLISDYEIKNAKDLVEFLY